jgi:hypothetical protein
LPDRRSVEVVVEGAGEQDVAGNGGMIERGSGLHRVIRRAGGNNQRRIIRPVALVSP